MRPLAPTPLVATLALTLAAAAPLAAQPDLSDVTVETVPVAGNIHMLTSGNFGNVGVSAGADGILIVDDKIAPLEEKVRAALAGIAPGSPVFVLNTHWHQDHTHGNIAFGPEGTIVAHHNVRARLATDQEIRGNTFAALPEEAWPVVTFGDSLSIWFNGEEVRAIHLGGHTDGDIVVWFRQSNVVHMGDLFFTRMLPFVDLVTGGDAVSLEQSIADVLAFLPADAKVIPGHGSLGTVDDLREYHRMLVETIDHVRTGIDAGRSLEELQAAGLPDPWDEWAWSFIDEATWIGIVHASLTGAEAGPASSHGH